MKILLFFTSIVVIIAVSVALECWGPDFNDPFNKNCMEENSDTVDTAKCVKTSCESQGKCVQVKAKNPYTDSSMTMLGGCIPTANGCHKTDGRPTLCYCDTNLCNAAKPNGANRANAVSVALECWGPDVNDPFNKNCMAMNSDTVDTAKCVKQTCENQGKCVRMTQSQYGQSITVLGGCVTLTNGCHDTEGGEYCLCDTDLCNAAKTKAKPKLLEKSAQGQQQLSAFLRSITVDVPKPKPNGANRASLTGVGVTVAGFVAILYR